MLAYVIRRMISGLAMLFAMSFITYLLFFNGAVDPARYACGKACGNPGQVGATVLDDTRISLGYDKPVLVQYGNFVKGLVQGRDYPENAELARLAPETVAHCDAPCLGYSVIRNESVNSLLKDKIPISASLAVAAFVMWIVAGVSGGVIAALFKGRWPDKAIVGGSLIFYAFPTFFIGYFLYLFLAIRWQVTPKPVYTPLTENPQAWLLGLFLPGLTLALFYMAAYVRLTRSFVLESMGEDYLRTAKAKGLAPRKILTKHTMRAALTPLVTVAGLDFAGLLGGAIITENVFNYPGLGKLAVDSARSWDLPIVVGIVILLAAFIIVANIIVDVLYAVIDPRVKYS